MCLWASLRGRVLPVGGVKEKVLAAHRAGLTRAILPSRNERDLVDIPEAVQDEMEFVFVEDMSEVLDAALEALADDELLDVDGPSTTNSALPPVSA